MEKKKPSKIQTDLDLRSGDRKLRSASPRPEAAKNKISTVICNPEKKMNKKGNSTSLFKTPLPPKSRPMLCHHCKTEKDELQYVFPTASGHKLFCSVPCLSTFRTAWKNFEV